MCVYNKNIERKKMGIDLTKYFQKLREEIIQVY